MTGKNIHGTVELYNNEYSTEGLSYRERCPSAKTKMWMVLPELCSISSPVSGYYFVKIYMYVERENYYFKWWPLNPLQENSGYASLWRWGSSGIAVMGKEGIKKKPNSSAYEIGRNFGNRSQSEKMGRGDVRGLYSSRD